jgi:hypothetical protein
MSQQLGFDALLADAKHVNDARAFDKLTSHLPSTMEDALLHYRQLIARHNEAMLAAEVEAAMSIREEAHNLAVRLNGGTSLGIIADDDAPGCVLAARTAAPCGTIPLWGQDGSFIVTVEDMRVRVELEGMFGIGASFCYWPGFSAHIVDRDLPFLSETGFRSFLGSHVQACPMTPEEFVTATLSAHIRSLRKTQPLVRRR